MPAKKKATKTTKRKTGSKKKPAARSARVKKGGKY